MRASQVLLVSAALLTILARPAAATFHEMQIEQVIGRVDGATKYQAIQLRMRAAGQNLVSNARLVAHDATGANPVVLIAFPTNVTKSTVGSRILAATSGFSGATHPALTPDFVLTNPIPDSYLAAGSLTYEDNVGTILWRVSWGGASYTGPGTGSTTNDVDGQFNPDLAGAMPSTAEQAFRFKFAATAASTNNANDYALTAGAAVFHNNNGDSGTVVTVTAVGTPAVGSVPALGRPSPNPVRTAMSFSVSLPRQSHVNLRVVDPLGRVVRTLSDEVMAPGRHELSWSATGPDAAALPSGMYFLSLDADGVRRTQRFVLVR